MTRTRAIIFLCGVTVICYFLFRPGPAPTTTGASLGLPAFYASHFRATKTSGVVDAISEPEMGWRTGGKPVVNPTKVATQGLQAVLAGDNETARKCADWLMAHSRETQDSVSFPFEFDFVPYWPFEMRAPWSSAITQGLALGLMTQLYLSEHRAVDLDAARKIAAHYFRPVEQGGFTRFEQAGPFFEEYPCVVPTRVLNGSLIAMIALHDFSVAAKDAKAAELFSKAVARLKVLLPEYESFSLEEGCRVSAYSLAPIRPRLVMRLKGDGTLIVHSIRFVGDRAGKPETLASLDVGGEGDDDPSKPLYIWDDPKFMNWGPPAAQGATTTGRVVNEHKGQFDHAPFVLGWLPEFDTVKNWRVEISYEAIHAAPLFATVYDGTEYWPLGVLTCDRKAVQTATCPIPAAFPFEKLHKAAREARIDVRYLDDNQRLLEILANLSGDSDILGRAARWKDSCLSVPARWMNWATSNLITDARPAPVALPMPGYQLLGQACALRIGDATHLYYCAAASDDHRSRIYLATSPDLSRWTLNGQVLADAALPLDGNESQPFVAEVEAASDPRDRFLMVFALSDKRDRPGGRLATAWSPNGSSWRFGEILPTEDIVDAVMVPVASGGCELFYIPMTEGYIVQVMHRVSTDGKNWNIPRPVVRQPLHGRNVFDSRLSGTIVSGRCVLLLEIGAVQNRHVLLFVRDGQGRFRACPRNPVYVCDEWENRWDAVRTDWCLPASSTTADVFFSGRRSRNPGPTDDSPVGTARLNFPLLRDLLTDVDAWPVEPEGP